MRRRIAVVITMALMTGLMGCQNGGTEQTTGSTTEKTDSAVTESAAGEETEEDSQATEIATESEETTEEMTEDVTMDSPVTIAFETKNDDRTNAKGDVILYVSYTRPIIEIKDNEEATTAIEQEIAGDEDTFFLNSNALAEEAALVFEDGVTEDMPAYANEVRYTEKRADDRVVSLERNNYSNTGGVHGSTFVSGVNFDVKTGKKLTIDDITEDKDLFMSRVREYVLGICQSDAYKDRLMPGYEANLDFVLQDDLWYFDSEGITFIANPYELAAYAEGVLYFTIPYTELEGLKTDYFYAGGFRKSVNLGETITIDLDGDGTNDELMFDTKYNGDYEYVPILTINGADYSQTLANYQCYFAYPYEEYVVLDIDDSDSTLEIALQDYGMSDDPRTTFFQYDGNKLNCLGTIYDRMSDMYISNDGKGVLDARERMGVFETAMIKVSYKVEDGTLVRDMKDLYPISYYSASGVGMEKTVLQDFVVYEDMGIQSNTVTLAKDSVVSVIATDDTEWVQVKDATNNVYYVHLVNGFYVEVEGEAVPVSKVLDPIFMAG